METRGVQFGIVRCFQQTNVVDPNAVGSIKNAWQAGLSSVDVYHFPAVTVSAVDQTDRAVDNLARAGVKVGRYWLDVEVAGAWSRDPVANVDFIQQWVDAANASLGQHPQLECEGVGFYTRSSDWATITGGSQAFAQYPLWFVKLFDDPDPQRSFDAFEPFGGWTKPHMVQWAFEEGFDANWMP